MKNFYLNTQHFWHIVTVSPWPIALSCLLVVIPLGGVAFMHGFTIGLFEATVMFALAFITLFFWFRDICREASFEGRHSSYIQMSLMISMALFIFSEVMFFAAFFWSYFHSSISPVMELGLEWPPINIDKLLFSPWDVPLLNTLILLLSGATITVCHLYIQTNNREESIVWFLATILLAIAFLLFQLFEYSEASFDISDGIYATTFYLCTGFHGFHVLVGTIMLITTFLRLLFGQLSPAHHFGFEASAWYWHFVDVVWLFLFITIYIWGSNMVYPNIISKLI